MSELKRCPFCGTEAHVEKSKYKMPVNGRRRRTKKDLVYAIGCSDPTCILYSGRNGARLLFTVSKDGLETMARRWNRRVKE